MSRVGKQPIKVPSGVSVKIEDSQILVSGARGSLSMPILPGVLLKNEGETVVVSTKSNNPGLRAKHGLTRTLINNMVEGVDKGFSKKLEVHGVGYRVNLSGQDLKLGLGYSHEVIYKIPESVSVSVDQNTLTISGIDKQQVGQVAAEIRALKKPEPYKGKGIRYANERIIRKSGKSAKEK